MMKLLMSVALMMVTGCASILGNAPTFEYCQDIVYTRHGNLIEVTAKCSAPIGGGAIPVPKVP